MKNPFGGRIITEVSGEYSCYAISVSSEDLAGVITCESEPYLMKIGESSSGAVRCEVTEIFRTKIRFAFCNM